MSAERILRRAVAQHVELHRLGLNRHQVEDLVDVAVSALLLSDEVVVVEDVPTEEDEAVLICPPGVAVEAWPVSGLAANGVPKLPVWTAIYEPAAREPLVVFELPHWAVLLRRRWWRWQRNHEAILRRLRKVAW